MAEDARYIRDVLAKEIDHRRTRREQIFTWASTLLVSILGGTIGLTHATKDALQPLQLAWTIGVSVALGVFAFIWLQYHWHYEQTARAAITERNAAPSLPAKIDDPSRYPCDLLHVIPLGVLVILTVVAVWVLNKRP